ncbi:hypothetical protein [Serratia sp. (in: enterobacteria)]|uniref:hypothetical protein n=1 Tax=Serratia sp. (in: enterobacteria) TaxID=616 RepID=UPI00398A03BC
MSTSTTVTDNTTHNLFDVVSGSESLAGDTEYRACYLLNNHGSLTAQDTRIYISSNTTSADTSLEIALAGEGLNTTIETVVNENTAPVGETFSSPSTYAAGLSMGNIPNGQRYGFWAKRIVNSSATAVNDDTAIMKFDCDTAA